MTESTIRDGCTGAELVDAVRHRARQLGVPANRFVSALTNQPASWFRQTEAARRPKPATIARVRALLAGDEVSPARPDEVQAERVLALRFDLTLRGDLLRAFDRACAAATDASPAEVAANLIELALAAHAVSPEMTAKVSAKVTERRADAGVEAPSCAGDGAEPVSRPAAGRTAAATSELMDVTAGETALSPAARLRAEVFAESRVAEERRRQAQVHGSGTVVDFDRHPAGPPPAPGREPCPRCGVG